MAASPREHIEEIRRLKFSIGGEPNPLTEDLHHAVRSLSSELYTKDVHFLMELIQNAEDNEYPPELKPTMEFIVTSEDITGTGAPATLLVFNNEIGFSKRNIESICSIGRSTKKGKRDGGFIGEKGIGFKSVFLVTTQPYVFSNGYQIKFNEEPCSDCKIGYIVPQWVDSKPTVSDIQVLYGAQKILPTTVIILPLKPDKVQAVKKQLSSIHPEILLFLTKVKHLSVNEASDDHISSDRLTEISISSETDFETRKDIDADSRIVYLSSMEGKNKDKQDCNYYLWRQRFPVNPENRVEVRNEIEEWVISLAFPFGERLRSMSPIGIYAFLPTEMVTDLPFVIQADFILSSSRESIRLDNKWNIGILDCVPTAFVNSFLSMVKSAPVSSLAPIFNFLPIHMSNYDVFNNVIDSIKERIQDEDVMPCESFSTVWSFCKPGDSGRLLSGFREILHQLNDQGLPLATIYSHGKQILHTAINDNQFQPVLSFLGVEYMNYDWYCNCIQGGNFAYLSSDNAYLKLLCFIAENWYGKFDGTTITEIPLLRYMDQYDNLAVCSISSVKRGTNKLCMARDLRVNSWLKKWNAEFSEISGVHFFPTTTLFIFYRSPRRNFLMEWLQGSAGLEQVTAFEFCKMLRCNIRSNRERNVIIAYTFLLYKALSNCFINEKQVKLLCNDLPLVASNGTVLLAGEWSQVMVPPAGSQWAKLMGSNPWRQEKYVDLAEEYYHSFQLGGESISSNQLRPFLGKFFAADDIPFLFPPNADLPSLASEISPDQAFLLLDWISFLSRKGETLPYKFKKSVVNGMWLKTATAFMSPCKSLLASGEANSVLADVSDPSLRLPIIDVKFYGDKIESYDKALTLIGVKCGKAEACGMMVDMILKSCASPATSKDVAVSLLKLVRYMKENEVLAEPIVGSLRKWKWLKTTHGNRNPPGSAFLTSDKETVEEIADLPLVDETFYEGHLGCYIEELKLVGVAVDQVYHLIVKNFALNKGATGISKEAAFLILKCIQMLENSDDTFVNMVRHEPWLRTSIGFCCPEKSILISCETEQLVSVFSGMLVIDENFYGCCLQNFYNELHKIGVAIDLRETFKRVIYQFKLMLYSSCLSKDHVLAMLKWLQDLPESHYPSLVKKFKKCMDKEKWLKTSTGYRLAKDSVMLHSGYGSLDSLMNVGILPLIDDFYYGNDIYSFREELKLLGVVVDYVEGLKFVAQSIVLPEVPSQIAPEDVYSILEFIGILQSDSSSQPIVFPLVSTLKQQLWLKTAIGYKLPKETVFPYAELYMLLRMLRIPVMDETFYGNRILAYRTELRMLGVEISPSGLGRRIGRCFKALSTSSELTDSHVLTLLECCKNWKEKKIHLLLELENDLANVKWLKTKHGYRCCKNSVLSDPNWEVISRIADVPFIDDAFYSEKIYLYKEELKILGVATDIVEGCYFVAESLTISNPLPSNCVMLLLQCLKSLVSMSNHLLPGFISKLKNTMWIKTKLGYRYPKECLLYDSKWATVLQQEDAPFIDASFYGPNISLYQKELQAIGVISELTEVCSLIASSLKSITNFSSIRRVYNFLRMCEWKFELSEYSIWIPKNSDEGLWVCPQSCLIYDMDNLFISQTNILSNYFDNSLLEFFSSAFQVPKLPTQKHYINLWIGWENSKDLLSFDACCSFWSHVLSWDTISLKDFGIAIHKLPASNSSGEIQLVDRDNVFMPDILLLKEMILKATDEPLFVWHPKSNIASVPLADLFEAYKIFGVKNISQAVTRGSTDLAATNSKLFPIDLRYELIGEGLMRLVIGFLSNPEFRIPSKTRQKKARSLLKLAMYETDEPIILNYSLVLKSKQVTFDVRTTKLVSLEKNSSTLLVQRVTNADKRRQLDFATDFAKEVAEGLLWTNPELISGLYTLIRTGCLLNFDVDAVNTLLKLENLQIFVEDEEFIKSAMDQLAANIQ